MWKIGLYWICSNVCVSWPRDAFFSTNITTPQIKYGPTETSDLEYTFPDDKALSTDQNVTASPSGQGDKLLPAKW
jgi:hypothetical protein